MMFQMKGQPACPGATNSNEINKSDDLSELLNEAKSTIIKFQRETALLKSEIDMLRQKNQEYCKQIETLQNQIQMNATLVNDPISTNQLPIPLEPIVIVKENLVQKDSKTNQNSDFKHSPNNVNDNTDYRININENSLASEQSSSDNTYLV